MENLLDVTSLSNNRNICEVDLICKLSYAKKNNFTGKIVDGDTSSTTDLCLLAPKAAHALCNVQNFLTNNYHLELYVFDAYRPLRAVKDFYEWSLSPISSEHEQKMKKKTFSRH